MPDSALPYAGIRVVEFTHMVMGPTCGMVLADLGAEVIKVEPIDGDRTRRLLGAGSGFFPMFNRNKKSIAIDLHKPEGAALARRLCASADVVAENFKPGTMERWGLGPDELLEVNPGLVYARVSGYGQTGPPPTVDQAAGAAGGMRRRTSGPDDGPGVQGTTQGPPPAGVMTPSSRNA